MCGLIPKFILIYWTWAAITVHILSAFKCLNVTWMLVAHIPLGVVLWSTLRDDVARLRIRAGIGNALRRHSRGFPLFFAVLAVTLLIGAAMALVPKQADYLEYRLSRMILWIMEGGMHWLHGWERRLNYNGTGQECAILPSILLFRSDFPAQVFSWLMFCTLPGLTFRILRGFDVCARLAVRLM